MYGASLARPAVPGRRGKHAGYRSVRLDDGRMQGRVCQSPVWDFAGQVITHALHQFFFSVRSVYVVVLTGRENNERDDAEYWLRLIKAFGTDDQGNGPPVIIALNKWDVPGCRPEWIAAHCRNGIPSSAALWKWTASRTRASPSSKPPCAGRWSSSNGYANLFLRRGMRYGWP